MPNVSVLSMWTIYAHPLDYPDGFVVRRHEVSAAGSRSTFEAVYAATLDEVRAAVPGGRVCIGRMEEDEEQIVESWV